MQSYYYYHCIKVSFKKKTIPTIKLCFTVTWESILPIFFEGFFDQNVYKNVCYLGEFEGQKGKKNVECVYIKTKRILANLPVSLCAKCFNIISGYFDVVFLLSIQE